MLKGFFYPFLRALVQILAVKDLIRLIANGESPYQKAKKIPAPSGRLGFVPGNTGNAFYPINRLYLLGYCQFLR